MKIMSQRLYATMRKERSVPKFVKQSKVVVGKMKNHAKLTSPPVPYPEVEKHIGELDQAEQDAHNGGHGTAADRDAKLEVVALDMGQLLAYAEAQANAEGADGAALLEGVGLFVVKRTISVKAPLSAKHGKV